MAIHTYKNSEHSFFDDLVGMLSSFAGLCIARETFLQNGFTTAPTDPNYYMKFEGKVFPIILT